MFEKDKLLRHVSKFKKCSDRGNSAKNIAYGTVEYVRVDGHGKEPICQAGGQHGPIEEKLDWYNRLGGVLALNVNEQQEGDEGQGKSRIN